MYTYSSFTLLHRRNYHNIAKQLYSNKRMILRDCAMPEYNDIKLIVNHKQTKIF